MQVPVTTKLHLPAPRDGAVQRPAALERLEQGRASRLTLVCAPAGWGKTSVLAEWHAADAGQRAFAWVSLDPSDDDPSRLRAHARGDRRGREPLRGPAREGPRAPVS